MKPLALFLGLVAIGLGGRTTLADDQPTDEQKDLFDKLDADGNGTLSPSEIPEAQARFFERLVRVGDEDGNGELSHEEFLKATTERDEPVTQPGFGGPGRRSFGQRGASGFPIERLFERFDANDDGKLTLEEIPEPARPQLERLFAGRDEITREQFRTMRNQSGASSFVRRLDPDGDGKVKLSDLPPYLRPRLEPVFEKLDSDELDVQRILEALRQEGPRQPGAGAPFQGGRGFGPPPFLRVLDGDGDGRLSRDELAAATEKFDELDRNGDGQIDVPELFGFPREGMQRPGAQGFGQRPRRPERDNGRPQRPESDNANSGADRPGLIPRFDKDGDQSLSEEEAPEFLKRNFSRIDANGDGQVTAEELRSSRRPRPE